MSEILSKIPPTIAETAAAFEILKTSMQADFEYAWSWHCNIAMAIKDTGDHSTDNWIPSDELSTEFCNEAAARFMKLCFNVDTSEEAEKRHHPKV